MAHHAGGQVVDGVERYPGIRYVWNVDTGEINKLTDLTLSGTDSRGYDFSRARDLLRGWPSPL